jgi:hypothetical protein
MGRGLDRGSDRESAPRRVINTFGEKGAARFREIVDLKTETFRPAAWGELKHEPRFAAAIWRRATLLAARPHALEQLRAGCRIPTSTAMPASGASAGLARFWCVPAPADPPSPPDQGDRALPGERRIPTAYPSDRAGASPAVAPAPAIERRTDPAAHQTRASRVPPPRLTSSPPPPPIPRSRSPTARARTARTRTTPTGTGSGMT